MELFLQSYTTELIDNYVNDFINNIDEFNKSTQLNIKSINDGRCLIKQYVDNINVDKILSMFDEVKDNFDVTQNISENLFFPIGCIIKNDLLKMDNIPIVKIKHIDYWDWNGGNGCASNCKVDCEDNHIHVQYCVTHRTTESDLVFSKSFDIFMDYFDIIPFDNLFGNEQIINKYREIISLKVNGFINDQNDIVIRHDITGKTSDDSRMLQIIENNPFIDFYWLRVTDIYSKIISNCISKKRICLRSTDLSKILGISSTKIEEFFGSKKSINCVELDFKRVLVSNKSSEYDVIKYYLLAKIMLNISEIAIFSVPPIVKNTRFGSKLINYIDDGAVYDYYSESDSGSESDQ
jgi:hypothetical protein